MPQIHHSVCSFPDIESDSEESTKEEETDKTARINPPESRSDEKKKKEGKKNAQTTVWAYSGTIQTLHNSIKQKESTGKNRFE